VSVSLDEPEDEPQVREFLIKQGAEFENLLSKSSTAAARNRSKPLGSPGRCRATAPTTGRVS
jgi:hypothetical protein